MRPIPSMRGDLLGGLSRIGAASGRGWGALALFSFASNLALLTGPVFMLAVYDRVIPAGSTQALAQYGALAALFYAATGAIDLVRGRIATRLGLRADLGLAPLVLQARLTGAGPEPAALDAINRLMTGPVFAALCDLPFAPLFLAMIYLADPWLGLAATLGAAAILILGLSNHMGARRRLTAARPPALGAEAFARAALGAGDAVAAMGMTAAVAGEWQRLRAVAAAKSIAAADHALGHAAASRVVRMALQSALLAAGAVLVMGGSISGGAMVAASVLMGRALAPVEILVAQWPSVADGAAALRALGQIDDAHSLTPAVAMQGEAGLSVTALAVPGVLRELSFTVSAGQALGVVGPSGAGKSTLLRALAGAIPDAAGRVLCGGAPPDPHDTGYLPQNPSLLPGTIARNVARFSASTEAAVWRALAQAGAEGVVRALPCGTGARLGTDDATLSGGQIQRIALARALFGAPRLLLLDEPNAHLDAEGLVSLNAAVDAAKARGAVVVIAAHHRSALISCDMVLAIEGGTIRAFGPRDAVLAALDQAHGAARAAQPRRAAG